MDQIVIVGESGLCSLGKGALEIQTNYSEANYDFKSVDDSVVAPLSETAEESFLQTLSKCKFGSKLDRSVYLGIAAAEAAYLQASWSQAESSSAVLMGSSRGGTGLWESYHKRFLENKDGKSSVFSSPFTTFGNTSSSVAQALGFTGLAFDQSVTCSTGLHALVSAYSLVKSGMTKYALAGGTESPITEFTLAQMKALKIYSSNGLCRPLSSSSTDYNSFILGEGSGVFAVEAYDEQRLNFYKDNKCPVISSLGFAQEQIESPTFISRTGNALKLAMKRALQNLSVRKEIDAIFVHAPGTEAGDQAELNAIEELFLGRMPNIYTNKCFIGHCFAASGPLSMLCAIGLLKGGSVPILDYKLRVENKDISNHKTIMINSTGFGGNAVSIILDLPRWGDNNE